MANGTTYEAEAGVRTASTTIISNSVFSGGEAVGYLGSPILFTLFMSLMNFRQRRICYNRERGR